MDQTPLEIKLESIRSLQSTIRKSKKALAQMTRKGANSTLITKRLKSAEIGLAAVEHLMYQTNFGYTPEELAKARDVLFGLLPALETQLAKFQEPSAQRTLLERRIAAQNVAIRAIDALLTSIE